MKQITLNVNYDLIDGSRIRLWGIEHKTDSITLTHDIKPSALAIRIQKGWNLVRGGNCRVENLVITKIVRQDSAERFQIDGSGPVRMV